MLDVETMLAMQSALQERYRGWWEPIEPARGLNKLMWMIGEVGEVSQILKRKGADAVMNDPQVRADMVEELCDVLMFFSDVLLCYGITAEEFERAYRAKHQRNLSRWKAPE
ncbi:MAG: nucleotide pyrophosphohydrolase [Clostridia bacterium]|nr:nucleotide pyrophosphohydrolase [Clostridia bacterium]